MTLGMVMSVQAFILKVRTHMLILAGSVLESALQLPGSSSESAYSKGPYTLRPFYRQPTAVVG